MKLAVHRGSGQIGGNCIELRTSSGERLLLDAGRPLDTPEGIPAPLPATLDTAQPVSGILLSHAHADHCGLLEALPAEWPVYCGEATEVLLRLSAGVGRKTIALPCFNWESGRAVTIGPFTVTPRLIDHSAFDAYALQIDAEGKTVVYSGDFRAHGRKDVLTKGFIQRPPRKVDALIMEGTNLPAADSAPKPTPTEAELEGEFIRLFNECKGRVFVSWSATNIDRTVTLYKACTQSGRVLVPDLYCALVLKRLEKYAKIPQAEWQGGHMQAVVTPEMARLMRRLGAGDFIDCLKGHQGAIGAGALTKTPERWVVMVRDSLLPAYARKGVVPDGRDAWVWSMWRGYLEQESTRAMRAFFTSCQPPVPRYIHSSGHASPDVLREFTGAMNPALLIPVHGESWPAWAERFPNLRIAANGEWLELPV